MRRTVERKKRRASRAGLQQSVILVKPLVERERLDERRRAHRPAALEREVVVEVQLLLEPRVAERDVLVLPDAVQEHARREALNRRVGRTEPRAAMREIRGHHAAAADEAARGAKVVVDARRGIAQAEVAPVAIQDRLPDGRPRRGAVRGRPTGARLQLHVVDRLELQSSVGGDDAVRIRAVDPIRVREADLRRAAQAALQAHDIEQRMIGAGRRRRDVVGRREQGDVRAGRLPGQFHGRHGRGDLARVDQVVRRPEQLCAVEEERALLRKEQCGARIVGELRRIGFDLREIGIHRSVQREVRRDAPPHVAAELRPVRVIRPAIAGRQAVGLRRDDRVEIEDEAAAEIGQPVERARLREEGALRAQRGRPAVFLSAALHAPRDVEAPRLHACGGKTGGLERDRDLDLVAVVRHAPFRFVDVVGREVGRLAPALERAERGRAAVARAFHERAVGLNPERIDGEHQRLASVVERVQKDLDRVVGVDAVAAGERRVNRSRRRLRADAEIDGRRRVEDQDLRDVLRLPAIDRRVLREAGQSRRVAPRRVVEHTVDGDRALDPRRRDVNLVVPPAERGRRECECDGANHQHQGS